MDDVSERNKKGHRRSDRKQRHSTGFGHGRCNSSDNYLSNTDQHRKAGANKKTKPIFDACTDVCVINENRSIVFQSPPSEIYQRSISRDSDMEMDDAMRCGYIEYTDPSIDGYMCSETTCSTETMGNSNVLQECCEKTPNIDAKMIDDLNKALDNPSKGELRKIVCYVQNLPYDKNGRNPQVNQAVKSFRMKRSLSTKQLMSYLKNNIRKKILNRCSYGFLIINKDKDQFLAVRNRHGNKRWGAPKGHLKMKPYGQWETPFKAAVREANEEIHYFDSKFGQSYTIDPNILEEDVPYLECVLKDSDSEYRRIGLFIVCLQDYRKFYPKDLKEIDDVRWFPLQGGIDSQEFYTLYPFVEYVQNHSELLSH